MADICPKKRPSGRGSYSALSDLSLVLRRLLVKTFALFAGPESSELRSCQVLCSDAIGDNIQVAVFSDVSEICVLHRLRECSGDVEELPPPLF